MSLKYEPASEPQVNEVMTEMQEHTANPRTERESSLLTTYWSESTVSS